MACKGVEDAGAQRFSPTPRIVISASGCSTAAVIQKAADDRSPGTSRSIASELVSRLAAELAANGP